MATFDSIVFNEISGKMGAIVLQKNGTARRRVTGRDPKSSAQQAVRDGFSAANAAWKALTTPQRAGWTRLAAQVTLTNAVGKVYSPTGRRLFISCWQNSVTATPGARADAALGQPSDAPAFMPVVPGVGPLTATVTLAEATHPNGQITLACYFESTGYAAVIRATPQLYADRNSIGPGDFRVLAARASGGPIPTADELAALYTARFGALHDGACILFEVFQTDPSGFVSPVSRADTTVGATAQAHAPAPTDPLQLKAA